MKIRLLAATVAGLAMIASSAVVAQGRGAGQGHGNSGGMTRGHSGGMGDAQGRGVGRGGHGSDSRTGTQRRDTAREAAARTRAEARLRARADEKAAARAQTRANRNSVLSGSASTSTPGGNMGARVDGRANSRGPDNAADRALERANSNSVLSGSTSVGSLVNLRTGQMVHDSTGAMLGTVSRINRSPDGTVRNVLVATGTGGPVIALSPDSLSINGDVVTTTRLNGRR